MYPFLVEKDQEWRSFFCGKKLVGAKVESNLFRFLIKGKAIATSLNPPRFIPCLYQHLNGLVTHVPLQDDLAVFG